jgi:hypothetical protein
MVVSPMNAHGQAEDFGQCGIEGGAGLLLDLLQGFVIAEKCPFGSFGGQFVITHPLPAFVVAAMSL